MYFISKTDSRFTWIHDFEENLTESVRPVPFSAQYLICRPVWTDGQTDGQMDGQTDRQTNESGLGWVTFGSSRLTVSNKKGLRHP